MESQGQKRLKFRVVWLLIQSAGIVQWFGVFVVLFIIASAVVAACEPKIDTFANASWLMFQVVTTIGLGDFTCVSVAGRVAAVVLSLYSVFFIALITGDVVTYCQERMLVRRNESVAHFIDQLEHLPELSHEELIELSDQIRKLEKK